jgi:hypothetical protein
MTTSDITSTATRAATQHYGVRTQFDPPHKLRVHRFPLHVSYLYT